MTLVPWVVGAGWLLLGMLGALVIGLSIRLADRQELVLLERAEHPRTTVTTVTPQLIRGLRRLHVHRFRRVGDDPFSSAILYACRCGLVRPAP